MQTKLYSKYKTMHLGRVQSTLGSRLNSVPYLYLVRGIKPHSHLRDCTAVWWIQMGQTGIYSMRNSLINGWRCSTYFCAIPLLYTYFQLQEVELSNRNAFLKCKSNHVHSSTWFLCVIARIYTSVIWIRNAIVLIYWSIHFLSPQHNRH